MGNHFLRVQAILLEQRLGEDQVLAAVVLLVVDAYDYIVMVRPDA